MVAMGKIENFCKEITRRYNPTKVVLFGSHAENQAEDDSDVDILVIMNYEGKSVDHSVQIRMDIRPGFPLDLLVRTPEYIKSRLEKDDPFYKHILSDGKVLYEADSN